MGGEPWVQVRQRVQCELLIVFVYVYPEALSV
jgi:hypothetical protein